MRTVKNTPVLFLGLTAAIFAGGCGGTGDSAVATRSGRLSFNVTWPKSTTRVIPTVSRSLQVQLVREGQVLSSQLLVSPATSVSFNTLPIGTITVRAVSFPNADGSGNAVAKGSFDATIVDGQTTPANVTMASTIDHLVVTPPSISFLGGVLGQSQQLTVTAYDAQNVVVLYDPNDLTYSSNNLAQVTVGNTGLVQHVGLGLLPTAVTVTDRISGKSAVVPIRLL